MKTPEQWRVHGPPHTNRWGGPGTGGETSVVEPELRVTVELAPGSDESGPVLKVSGEIDIQTSPILDEQLRSLLGEGATSIVVDLADVVFLDSTGLSVLVAALKRCQSVGGTVRLVSLRPNVRRVVEVTGLTDAFQVGSADREGPSD